MWFVLITLLGVIVLCHIEMPRDTWDKCLNLYPPFGTVTEGNADTDTVTGEIKGWEVALALKATKSHLMIAMRGMPFLRRKTISVPWRDIRLLRTWADGKGRRFGLLEFKHVQGCRLTVPWRVKFNQYVPNSLEAIAE